MPKTIGSLMPSAMKLMGFHSRDRLGRLQQQVAREVGRRQEQDHEHQREDPLHDAGLAALQRQRRADRAEGDRAERARSTTSRKPGTPPWMCAPKIRPTTGTTGPRAAQDHRGDQAAEHDHDAPDRRRDQPVDEADLDVERQADSRGDAREHRALHHRPGELEVQEAVHVREARQVDRAAGATGVDGQEERREDDDRREELRAAERLVHGRRPSAAITRRSAARPLTPARPARRGGSCGAASGSAVVPLPRGGGRSLPRTRRRAWASRG